MDTSVQRSALVLGSISRDLIMTGGPTPRQRPGGGVHHGGLTLARLGAQPRVVTRVHPEDEEILLGPLRAERVEILALPSRATTTYLNDYSGSVDRHDLRAASDPIRPQDVPEEWGKADLIQLSPLHENDILPEVMEGLHGFKGLDVQGLLREGGGEGLAALPRFLTHLDVLQASEPDLPALLGDQSLEGFVRRSGLSEMIVTQGARGATIITPKGSSQIPARPVEGGDPVGAGDVFLASYLLLRTDGRGPADAARGATRACAEKLRHGVIPRGFFPAENNA